jgi:hypothetical protein
MMILRNRQDSEAKMYFHKQGILADIKHHNGPICVCSYSVTADYSTQLNCFDLICRPVLYFNDLHVITQSVSLTYN